MSNVVFSGQTKNGDEYIIRYPELADAPKMRDYINKLSLEHTYIRLQGEQISLEEEEKYLNGQLNRIAKHTSFHLLALVGDHQIGVTSIDMKDRTESHVGLFGISVAKDFRNEGIGRNLMKYILKEAEKNIPNLKVIELAVHPDNLVAIKMYESFDFVVFGRLPDGILYKGKYYDELFMYKKVR